MAVIALTSGMGTGVKYVAELVARQLGLEIVPREICSAGIIVSAPTARSPTGRGETRWDTGMKWLEASRAEESLANLAEVCRLAQRGNVLIWGATPLHFLSGVAQVAKVRVRTTMALRVRRIMACMGAEESEVALDKILQSDKRQAETLRHVFCIDDYEDASLYDAVIDTGREPAEVCAGQIAKLALGKKASAPSLLVLDAMIEEIQALRRQLDGTGAGVSCESTR